MFHQYPFFNASFLLQSAVWQKGMPIPGYDPALYRRDACGHAMRFSDHGDTSSEYGWEIDHIYPASKGGSDDLINLQPLYWANNRQKGDTYPWYCENAA